ncbi:MAG: hypothetical protein JNK53_05165 [Phycisphaerae bacterium]|nr:hypothetical protein [Phycisphaerae bacterium]
MTPVAKCSVVFATALLLCASASFAQQTGTAAPPNTKPTAPAEKPAAPMIGDPYPFDTCATSGRPVDVKGTPTTRLFDGRELRFCCDGCPAPFEREPAVRFAKLDAKIIKDQAPLYPLTTSVVTGADLPAQPYEFVYGNRLVRLGAESERAEFMKDPAKALAALNAAAIAKQSPTSALKVCPVSEEAIDTGEKETYTMVIAGRMVKLCCKGCAKQVAKDPAKVIAMVDKANRGEATTGVDASKQ